MRPMQRPLTQYETRAGAARPSLFAAARRVLLLVALVVFAIPLLLVLLAAAIVLAAIVAGVTATRRLRGFAGRLRGDGRKNVRVIRR